MYVYINVFPIMDCLRRMGEVGEEKRTAESE
jgi:hypothetical protein